MKLSIFTDQWEMNSPFVTSKESISHIETITVCLGSGGVCGRGEALGVDYLGETPATIMAQLENVRSEVEAGIGLEEINQLLPPGGARNALDCAAWDLNAKLSGKRAWEMLEAPSEPVTTVYTLSLDTPQHMAEEALRHAQFPVLKLKLNQHAVIESLKAIREARPDAKLIIDANGSWSRHTLESISDELVACGVEMVEQPLAIGKDAQLDGLDYPVTLCADESCQSTRDLQSLKPYYQMVNIKLDKCGGLSEAMKMVQWCRENDMKMMVGNMLGSSLAMAPAFIVAQYCRYVDLDGPLWQKSDRSSPLEFDGALITRPNSSLWG
ncbi:MAG: L-alanine-DL-glutamate epimerase-like enolase superfamily enzyme [Lysobacterales bacterium]|jgi:L-alanine-DL-glutamate epimerase-like enolase superfamily enzyme